MNCPGLERSLEPADPPDRLKKSGEHCDRIGTESIFQGKQEKADATAICGISLKDYFTSKTRALVGTKTPGDSSITPWRVSKRGMGIDGPGPETHGVGVATNKGA